MNIKYTSFTFFACLLFGLSSCHFSDSPTEMNKTIRIGAAMSEQTTLNASDYFRKVCYVPLETTDSCLVGLDPIVQIIGDKVLVHTSQKQCLLFDKATGKYLYPVGHEGNDPEGYCSSRACLLNEQTGSIYFEGWKDELVCYGVDGFFKGVVKIPEGKGTYSYLDDHTIVSHSVGMFGKGQDRVSIFRDNEAICTICTNEPDSLAFGIDEIESIFVLKGGDASKVYSPVALQGAILIEFKGGEKASVTLPSNTRLWRVEQNLYFKEAYNDTIYQVKDSLLIPSRLFDLGEYHWNYDDRFEKKCDNAIVITQILESENLMLCRFLTGIYHKEKITNYNALLNKTTGELKISTLNEGIIDDLTDFLSFQPLSVSHRGEYAGLIPADQVVSWFEENIGTKDLPKEIQILKQVKEEDNPVVVIME